MLLAALFHRAVHGIADDIYTAQQKAAWAPDRIDHEAWQARCAQCQVFVATEEDQIVGFIGISGYTYIDTLFIDPLCQGQGVASALLAYAQKWAKAHGASYIEVHASLVAKPFLLSKGYQLLRENVVVREGEMLVNFFMRKEIRQA